MMPILPPSGGRRSGKNPDGNAPKELLTISRASNHVSFQGPPPKWNGMDGWVWRWVVLGLGVWVWAVVWMGGNGWMGWLVWEWFKCPVSPL